MRRFAFILLTVSLALSPCVLAEGTANTGEVQLTREGKASIQMALQYLAARQRADGSIGDGLGNTTAGVAAACLAWMAEGNLPGEGPYGKNVAKGVDFLLRCAQPSGMIAKPGDSSYHHGLAAICLSEAWGQTRDKRIGDKLKRAIELTVRTQNDHGGWHYWRIGPRVEPDDDLSTTVMQLLALRAAKDAGIAVPKEVIDKALRYVESCRSPKDNEGLAGFSYTPGGGKTWSTTSLGLMSLMLCGNVKAKDLKDGLEYLYKSVQRKQDTNHFVYGHYYGAMAMYRAGGQDDKFREYWLKWYPEISQRLMKAQITAGPQRGKFNIEAGYGAWSQGMCVVILGIPYRYLPIYQR